MPDKNLTLSHQGDHHLAKIEYDPATKRASAGAILGFSDHSTASVEIKDNKTKVEFAHSGGTHALKAGITDGGTFGLEYKDTKKGGLELKVEGDVVSLQQGKIPKAGLLINGDHHKVDLSLNEKGQVSGTLESKLTKNGSFRIAIENGKLEKAELVHSGKSHELAIAAGLNGDVKLDYAHGKGDAKFNFSVEKKGEEVKAFGGLKLRF